MFIFQAAKSNWSLQVDFYFTSNLRLSWNFLLWFLLPFKNILLLFNYTRNLIYTLLSFRMLYSLDSWLLTSGYSFFLYRLSSSLFSFSNILYRLLLIIISLIIRTAHYFPFNSGTSQFWLFNSFSKFIFPFYPKISDRINIERKDQEYVAPHYDS